MNRLKDRNGWERRLQVTCVTTIPTSPSTPIKSGLLNYSHPAVFILLVAILNGAKLVIQFLTDWSCFTILREFVGAVLAEIIDSRNGADHGRGATCSRFFECCQLLFKYGSTFNFKSHILGQLHQAFIGYGREDRLRLRGDVGVIFNPEEIGRATFIYILLFAGVKVKHG